MSDDLYADYRHGDNLKAMLSGLALDLVDAQKLAEDKKLEWEAAQAVVTDLSEKVIPSAAEGLEGDFLMDDGRKLQIKEVVSASISGGKRLPAIKWLDDNGYGSIVKHQVVFHFDRNRNELYQDFMEHIQSFIDKDRLVMTEEHNVHAQTLMAWVREKLKEGIELPRELLGIFVKHVAKIKE